MTSSVAFSNFSNIAVSDPNNPARAQSNYEIRITLRVNYEKAFFGDNLTQFTLFGTANEGRPYTFTYTFGGIFGDSVDFIERQLLYVPTGPNDPNVAFAPGFNQQAFFDFVNAHRIEAAKHQLTNDNDTTLAVALDVGFNSRSTFNAAFSKHAGTTPSAYRTLARVGEAESKTS